MDRHQIEEHSDKLHNMIQVYLQERGWAYSCKFPDSCWRWTKEIDGKLMVMNQSEAYSLQERLDMDQEIM